MTDLRRFGRLVKERRDQLGLAQRRAWQSGGPSMPTLSRIEHGELPGPNVATLRKLDAVLEWLPGSAKAALDGGDPVPLAVEQWTDVDDHQYGKVEDRRAGKREIFTGQEIARVLLDADRLRRARTDPAHIAELVDQTSLDTLPERIAALGRSDQLRVSDFVDEIDEPAEVERDTDAETEAITAAAERMRGEADSASGNPSVPTVTPKITNRTRRRAKGS